MRHFASLRITLAAVLLASCGSVEARPACSPEDLDGVEDEDGCADLDNDRDRVADREDRCPCHPEDLDGAEDADGCPDPDNDGDQLLDICDRCPDERETVNGLEDLDGCPDEARIRIQGMRSHIIPRFHFERGSARVEPAQFALLDELAAAMRDHPELERVEIQGHATPDERDPVDLAQRRAEAVRDQLLERGVDPARLVAAGHGSDRPIAAESTPGASERNRRVELSILRVVEPPAAQEAAPDDLCPDGPPPLPEGVCR